MKSYIHKTDKKGSALVIALFFAFCMLIMIGAMVFKQSNTASHNQISLLDKQAFFAARASMQHFLLKAKLFPTELYDAVEISQGKNPLFNFAEFENVTDTGNELFVEYTDRSGVYVKNDNSENDSNGKPRYFYTKLPSKNSYIRLSSYNNPDYRFIAPGLSQLAPEKKFTEPSEPSESYKAFKYLHYYFRDCCNYKLKNTSLQPVMEITKSASIKNINDFDITKEEGYPYTLKYSVVDVGVKAIQGMKKYGEEAIEITVAGEIVNFQNKTSSQLHNKTQKITRKGSVY